MLLYITLTDSLVLCGALCLVASLVLDITDQGALLGLLGLVVRPTLGLVLGTALLLLLGTERSSRCQINSTGDIDKLGSSTQINLNLNLARYTHHPPR